MRGKGFARGTALPTAPSRPLHQTWAGTCKDGTAFSNRKDACTVFALEAPLQYVLNRPRPGGRGGAVCGGRQETGLNSVWPLHRKTSWTAMHIQKRQARGEACRLILPVVCAQPQNVAESDR